MKKILIGGLGLLLIWIYSLESCVHEPILGPGDGTDTIKVDTTKPIDTIKPVKDKICDTTVTILTGTYFRFLCKTVP